MPATEYDDNLRVEWTNKELSKIAEIKARKNRPRQAGCLSQKARYLHDLLHYWEYFFHPEIDVSEKMQWDKQK